MFEVPRQELPIVSNDLSFYPIPFQMVLVLCSGFLFDIIGRRKTLFAAFLLSGISALIMPFTAPSVYPWLLLTRILFSVSVMPIMANTLVNDYVSQECRG
jgi:MFS family permease